MNDDDNGYNLFKTLVEEHSQYYANNTNVENAILTTSSSMSSLILGSEAGSLMDDMNQFSVDEIIDEGTSCSPKIIRCCPLEISLLPSVPTEERSMFGHHQNNGSINSKHLYHFCNFFRHFKSIFQHQHIDYDLNSALHGIRVIALLWTLASTIYIEGIGHNKSKLNFFWCGKTITNSHSQNQTNVTSSLSTMHELKFQKPIPSRLLGRGTALSFNIFLFLSSYILSQQIIKEYRRLGFVSISNFYLKRLMRIVPLSVVALVTYSIFSKQKKTLCVRHVLVKKLSCRMRINSKTIKLNAIVSVGFATNFFAKR